MFTAKIQNPYGEILELTHNPNYTVTSIEGLGPVNAAVNTAVMATTDGEMYNSSRKGKRNIVITVVIEGDIERNRLFLYKYARTKYQIRFYFKNEARDVYIDGYVESFEVDHFEKKQTAQISIICPQPDFKSVKEKNIEFASIDPLFYFELSIEEGEGIEFSKIQTNNDKNIMNAGDVETGIIIELRAIGVVKSPIIYNRDTGEKFVINFAMKAGDVIRVNTNVGEKSVILIRDGVETNIINAATITNNWFQIRTGDNIFTYECASGYEFLQLQIFVEDKFEGV